MPTTTTRPASPRRSPFVALAAVAIGSMSLLGIHLQAEPAAEDARPVEASPDASYALGYVIAHRLAEAGIDVDTAALREGFRDAHQAEAPRLTVDEMRSALATIVPAGDAAPDTPAPPVAEAPARAQAPRAAEPYRTRQVGSSPFSLRLDGQIPTGQINTAVPTTRINTLEADTEIRP